LGGPLPPDQAAKLVAVLARAVQAAHAAGVVHRDLKPQNVLLAPPVEGYPGNVLGAFPQIADFGLARLADAPGAATASGLLVGTPAYRSRERAAGKARDVGRAAEVWALGVILSRCLSGRVPFQGETALETLDLIKTQPPEPLRPRLPDLPADLEALCLRCL